MRRSTILSSTVAAVLGLGLTLSGARDAFACGGDFPPPNEDDSPVTQHRMIVSVSPEQTTLYDQIEFHGTASSFAWVLPIKGTATVGLSADVLFESLDQLTQTQVETPPTNCPPPPSCGDFAVPAEEGAGFAADAGAARHSGVTVTAEQQVGPYETVQLHASDPGALQSWLTSHGYAIPAASASVVSAYVAEKFDFLAMKLAPGKGVTAMRPVRVTTAGASPVLPLRMVAIGTGATTSITLWVVADGRWEPQNFPFFTVKDSEIAWTWATGTSDYEVVRQSKEAALGGRGWEVESSLELSQYTVTNTVDFGGTPVSGGFAQPQPASAAYLPATGLSSDAGVDGGGAESADAVRQEDLKTLFAGIKGSNARVTRLRTDIAHAALSADLTLQASSDQSELSNVHEPGQQIGEPVCPVFNTSCEQVGSAPRSQAQAMAAETSAGVIAPGTHGCSSSGGDSRTAPGAIAAFVGMLGLVAARLRRRTAR